MQFRLSIIGIFILGAVALLASGNPPAQAQERGANGCVTPQGFQAGDFITIVGGVYIRAEPNLDAAIVSYSPERIAARVIGGPICADGLHWWNVERIFNEPTFKGWVADGRPEKQFLFRNETEPAEIPCPVPLPVALNSAVELFEGVRVRQQPTRSARVLTVAPPATSALVRGGPVCSEGYNWWRIEVVVVGVTFNGWIIEGTPTGAVREEDIVNPQPDADPNTTIACGPPAPLNVGDVAILRYYNPPLKNLRAAPSTAGEVLYNLPSGIQLDVLSGPFCNEGVNWRQVRVRAGSVNPTGWIAEGEWLGRFLRADGFDYDEPAP